MQEVEKFSVKNGQLLKENTNFRYYFEQYSEYILKCKSFYKRVKSKKLYEDEFEKEMMEDLPENAKKNDDGK